MKTLKLCLGLVIGLATALLLWKLWPTMTAAWVAASLGVTCIILWAVLRPKKVVNKVISCVLVSTLAVSPSTLLLADDNYAGFDGKTCYCIEPAGVAPTPPPRDYQAFVLDFVLEDDPIAVFPGDVVPRIVSIRHPDPTTLVSFDEMNAALMSDWGITLDGGQQYSKNGQPAAPEEMPFTFAHDFSEQPFTLYPTQQQYQVVVEVTSELGEFAPWRPLAYFSIPANTRITVQDTPEGPQSFYRVRVQHSPEVQGFQPAGPILLGCGLGLLVGAGVIGVLAVRACARNKKKFDKMRPSTNSPPALQFNLAPAR